MARYLLAALLALASAAALPAAAPAPLATLAPADYVLAKLAAHPVVFLGEAHWIRHDAELVAALAPELARQRIVLAMETLRASDQPALDRLLAAPEWDERAALALQRRAAWPYREYLGILKAAWRAGRDAGTPLRIVALSPDSDWRERGLGYDAFLAERVLAEVEAKRRVLVYCGIHHAFTRYHQPELDLDGRARSFMDRSGNILRRKLGERVFLVTLHRPVWCGQEPWSYCLPLDGAIDCLAAEAGRPIGFDVAGTELGAREIDPGVYYAHGYATLAMSAYAAVIVSFLGGVHWGLAMRQDTPSAAPLIWGVVPSLLAWTAVMMVPASGLVIQGLVLLMCYLVDRRLYPAQGVAAWLVLRFRLSAVAALSCFIGAAGA